MGQIDSLLRYASERGASDLHLIPGSAPVLRINGAITALAVPGNMLADSEALAKSILSEDQLNELRQKRHLGFSLYVAELGRFRVEAFFNMGKVGAAIRLSTMGMPSLEELGTPLVLEQLCRTPNGLILVTGPTGAGKTTTLTAMVDFINRERACKIVTIEDPIEYVHQNKRSIIVQQEVFSDTPSFATALIHVLRQDPDIVVVGEMRSMDTIQTALTAAETGHLVMATLHTVNASQTVDRIIDVFPPHQQNQVRVQLASCLQAIISQKLLPRMDTEGRTLCCEVLINTPAVKNIVREQKVQQLPSAMQAGGEFGMATMDASLIKLYHSGIISYDTALDHIVNKKSLKKS
jgi:twitching motility protein PilT